MKTGAIVYIVGGEDSLDEDFDVIEAVKCLPIKADRIEVVAPKTGHFDIMDAWWMLITKGMNLIVCLHAEIMNRSKIRLTGRELRLCG